MGNAFICRVDRVEQSVREYGVKIQIHASRYRLYYYSLAGVIFVIGLLVSLYSIEFDKVQIRVAPLLLNAFVGAPLAIALNALSLQTAGRVIGRRIKFPTAFHVCAVATASNVLPMPAGTVIQSAALVAKGASIKKSGGIVILGNFISLALASSILGVSLFVNGHALSWAFLLVGLALFFVSMGFMLRVASVAESALFIGVRVVRIVLMVFRIQISFLVIGLNVGLLQAASFTGAIMLASTVAVIPSGLGVGELFAALIALGVSVLPAAAFVAVALNRLTTLIVAGAMAVLWRNERRVK